MIEYILRNSIGILEILEDGKLIQIDASLMGVLNRLANQSLRTVETTLKQTRKILHCSNKIPLYINDHILFLQLRPLRAKEPFLINYYAIAKSLTKTKDTITIYFKSGTSVDSIALNPFVRQMKLSNGLIDALESNLKNKKVFT